MMATNLCCWHKNSMQFCQMWIKVLFSFRLSKCSISCRQSGFKELPFLVIFRATGCSEYSFLCDLMISAFSSVWAQSGTIYLLRQLITSEDRNRHELWHTLEIHSDGLCEGFHVAALWSDSKSQMDAVMVKTSSGNSASFFSFLCNKTASPPPRLSFLANEYKHAAKKKKKKFKTHNK